MRHFFIDLENVRSYGLEGVLLLKPDDMVYVFYSDNANALTIPTIESLNESLANVKYIKTNYIGANAMDFQIVTLLGATIERDRTGSFYIISHDNGFKSAVKFCEGYFTTGYSIITGVYANILLAINSEKSDRENGGKKSAGSSEKKASGKKTGKNQNAARPDKKSEAGESNAAGQKAAAEEGGKAERAENGSEKKNRKGDGKKAEAVQNENDAASAETAAGEQNDSQPEGGKNKSGRSRRNRHRNKKNTASTPVEETTGISPEKTAASQDADVVQDAAAEAKEPAAEAAGTEKTSGRRSRSRNRRKNGEAEKHEQAGNEQAKAEKAKNEQAKPEQTGKGRVNAEGSRQYVYNALSDFLSKNTIDMYAKKIDEGIRKSANSAELHKFFKENYGNDEAEALYKIIASDFDAMKKAAK